jgi:hypothetical protein
MASSFSPLRRLRTRADMALGDADVALWRTSRMLSTSMVADEARKAFLMRVWQQVCCS